MDFVRVIYFKVMTVFGIADLYRNEQFMSKPDFLYNIEKLMITANLNSADRKKVSDDLIVIFIFSIVAAYQQFKETLKYLS